MEPSHTQRGVQESECVPQKWTRIVREMKHCNNTRRMGVKERRRWRSRRFSDRMTRCRRSDDRISSSVYPITGCMRSGDRMTGCSRFAGRVTPRKEYFRPNLSRKPAFINFLETIVLINLFIYSLELILILGHLGLGITLPRKPPLRCQHFGVIFVLLYSLLMSSGLTCWACVQ